MNWVVLQVYGKKDIFLEARFLLVSAYGQLMADAGCKVLIYTDNAAEIASWGFHTEKVFTKMLTPELIAAWKGKQDFVHRLKIEMLRDAAASLKPEKMLYLDSDMMLRGDLALLWSQIEPAKAVMHEDEGVLSKRANPIMRKMHRFVQESPFLVHGNSIKVDVETTMRNAGVIGLHKADFSLLDEVLALTDAMYALYPKHVIEQLAFSFVLGSNLQVYDSSPDFLHYWYAKELRQWLDRFFRTQGQNSIERQAVAARILGVEKVAASRWAWKVMPSWKRTVRRWFGKIWELPPYPTAL
jgi:hypothetical protein